MRDIHYNLNFEILLKNEDMERIRFVLFINIYIFFLQFVLLGIMKGLTESVGKCICAALLNVILQYELINYY